MRALPPDSAMIGFDIDAATREHVIAGAIAKLNENYVFPDTAKKMEQALRRHQKSGDYDALTNGDKFQTLLGITGSGKSFTIERSDQADPTSPSRSPSRRFSRSSPAPTMLS